MDLPFTDFPARLELPSLPSLEDWAGPLLVDSLGPDTTTWIPTLEGSGTGAAGGTGASGSSPSGAQQAGLERQGPSMSSSSGSEASQLDDSEDPLTAVLNLLEASACQAKPALPARQSTAPMLPMLPAQQSSTCLYAAGAPAAGAAGAAVAAAPAAAAVVAPVRVGARQGHGGKIKPCRGAEQQAVARPVPEVPAAAAAAPFSPRAPKQPKSERPWASPPYALPCSPLAFRQLGSQEAGAGRELAPPALPTRQEPAAAQPGSAAQGITAAEPASAPAQASNPIPQLLAPAARLDPTLASLPHLAYLTPPGQRKNRGGRMPAADPRLDPQIPEKRAKRILANRLAAARSKLRKQAREKGLTSHLQELQAEAGRLQAERAHLMQGCAAAEYEQELLLAQLSQVGPP